MGMISGLKIHFITCMICALAVIYTTTKLITNYYIHIRIQFLYIQLKQVFGISARDWKQCLIVCVIHYLNLVYVKKNIYKVN